MSSAVPSSKQGSAAVNRRPPPPSSGQLSFGGLDSRHERRGTNAAVAPPSPKEEIFSLVPGGDSPAFSMIIKLTPTMVDEMRRVEAEGGKARIKFDSNSNPVTSTGNIIEVGGREFRFMWSREVGDLCDIYEEHQSGEDGNGLLVESGCAWRKLNVQRILDESTKKHVKKMSEEAERKLRSRGTIVLEPGNPSMKSLAVVEASSLKNYSQKKEAALSKRSMKSFQVGCSSKSAHKPGSSSRTAFKGKPSSSLSFTPDQPTASSSPPGAANISKSIGDALPSQMIGKLDGNSAYEKGIPATTFSAMRETPRGKGNNIAKSIDLQMMLITLLRNKPHGLTLKGLEKAVQGIVPNPLEKMKPILRNIARYKSPGRYILLPGVDSESLHKLKAEIGSSSNVNHGQKPAHPEFCDRPAPLAGFKEKVIDGDLEEPVKLHSNSNEESNALEKASDHSKRQGGGTGVCESANDNENDRKNSGGDTRSHISSPARTGSGRSNESESDASFNSEEGVDDDVDIMVSIEEREPKHNAEASNQKLLSTIPLRSPLSKFSESEADEKQDNEINEVDIEEDLPEEQEAEMDPTTPTFSNKGGKAVENAPFLSGYDSPSQHQNNGDLKGESSSDDDSLRYLKYEKAEPEFKGPIKTMAQYQEYVQEYNEKYPDYASLLKNLEGFRSNFQQLCNDLEAAKNRDEGRYREILGRLKETSERHVPHHKRLKMIFVVLHKELEHMKQMISDFANAQNKKNARNKRM